MNKNQKRIRAAANEDNNFTVNGRIIPKTGCPRLSKGPKVARSAQHITAMHARNNQ